jgi:hypothetical protein
LDPIYKKFEEASRDIGIVLENVELALGEFGVSTVAPDSSKPYRIFLPKHVLLPGSSIDFETNMVRDTAEVSDELREYWNFYLRLSQGEEAVLKRQELERVIEKENLNEWMQENNISILRSFLSLNPNKRSIQIYLGDARAFSHRKVGRVFMPYLDFVNHNQGAPGFKVEDDGMGISGDSETKEVFVSYGSKDATQLLNFYGFVAPTDRLYAAPAVLNTQDGMRINLSRTPNQGVTLKNIGRGPSIRKTAHEIAISFFLIAMKNRPAASKISWEIGLNHAKGLTAKEKQHLIQMRSSIILQTYNKLWMTHRRAEQIQDETLRTLIMRATQESLNVLN